MPLVQQYIDIAKNNEGVLDLSNFSPYRCQVSINKAALLEAIKDRNIRNISLFTRDGFVDDNFAIELALALKNTNVVSIDLGNCDITETGFMQIIENLQGTAVHTIGLLGNKITIDNRIDLARFLSNTSIRAIDLSCNRITDNNLENLAEALKDSKVTTVSIRKNHLSITPIISFVSKLKESKISSLDLSDNMILDNKIVVDRFAQALPDNIEILNLSCSHLGDEGAKALAGVLHNTHIHTLDLRYNNIGSEGAKALAGVLHNTHIRTLDLEGNNNSVGSELAAEVWRSNRNNVFINLKYNNLIKPEYAALFNIRRNTNVTNDGTASASNAICRPKV